MARQFSPIQAKQLMQEFYARRQELFWSQSRIIGYVREAEQAANRMREAELQRVLKGIPVEELSRSKAGIRVKLLREHGYKNYADLARANVYDFLKIRGIGDESAYAIRANVNNVILNARNHMRIRLSADNQTPEATHLLQQISAYKKTTTLVQDGFALLDSYGESIDTALSDLALGTHTGLKWAFTSQAKKERATKAYQYLSGILNGDYGRGMNEVLQQIATIQYTPQNQVWDEFQNNSIDLINTLETIVPGAVGGSDELYGLPEDLAQEINDEAFFPDGLLCTLRRYQEWGVKYILHQEKALLGDEMGLGKTVQAIATMVSLKNTGATHFMVVCPASVLTNWCREIAAKSKLKVTRIHGASRLDDFISWMDKGGAAVTTYESISSEWFDKNFRFALLIVDEAHYVKNPEAMRTIHVRRLSEQADRILFMTGTALENKVDEMTSLIRMLQPQVAQQVRGLEALSSAPQFRKLVAPVYYRRKREDVLTELPEMIDNKEWCTLLPEEESDYEIAVLNHRYADARRVSWNIDDLSRSSKAKRLLELIDEAESDGRKVLVFSFFLDTIGKIKHMLGRKCLGPITGSVAPAQRQKIIDEFDKAPAGSVLVAQIQSGGTGLNIQSASVVVLCEPQFKPSVENQAISRAYRMGQTRNVLVYRLLCENTVDEKILALLEEKQAIFDAFADKSEAAKQSLELDDKGFGDIIKEEIERINAKHGNAKQ